LTPIKAFAHALMRRNHKLPILSIAIRQQYARFVQSALLIHTEMVGRRHKTSHGSAAAAARTCRILVLHRCGLGRAKTPAMVLDILENHAALCTA
jgi:hypothetical protein